MTDDDDRNKPPRGKGAGKGGKPRSGGGQAGRKPYAGKGGAAKGGAGRPFARRRDDVPGTGTDRPRFRSDDGQREGSAEGGEARPARSYGDGPRKTYDKKPFEKRASGDRKPFDKKPRDGKPSEKRPFADRPYGKKSFAEGGATPRPGRRERDMAAGERAAPAAGRPFRDGQRQERKPFARPSEKPGGPSSKERTGARRPYAGGEVPAEAGERIAKRLARAGIASRRDAEELIAAGRIRVNGQVLTSPAFNVMPEDRIELDGTEIPPIERTRLFLFNKPAGVVTTNRDPEGRRTVFDVLPEGLPRLMTVGRLDINTEGLLLLTNDGGLARVLELPATGWLRRYRVRVHGKVDEKALADLKDGIAVDGVFYGGVEASLDREQGTNAWLTIGLREGKNREVKNILGALGLDVTRLIRISYGPFQLGELEEGAIQELKGKMLRDQLGERLIEEAGANFEAPVAKPFSNKPVRAGDRRDEPEVRPKPAWTAKRVEVGEGGLIKNRKRDRERGREDALGRLTTRPERDFAGSGKEGRGPRKAGDREQRPLEAPGSRKANVWMAPGARPQGKASAAQSAKPGGRKPAGPKPFGGPAKGGKPGGSGGGARGPRKGGSGADRRR
jgi:23S rRNA pseudouridine2605 synthase